ncbi:MAG TPA: DUF4012 domain-containing protein [Vitreimonas sp.]|nr:DUF4012 domain-containing protein [Vitreimonas sp.]
MPENLNSALPSDSNDIELSQFAAHDESTVITTESSTTTETPKKRRRFLPKLWHKIVFALLLLFVVTGAVGAAVGFYTYNVVLELKSQALVMKDQGRVAYDTFKAQNLPGTEAELKKVEEQMAGIRTTYNKLSFYQYIPIARNYYHDGLHSLNAGDAGLRAGLKSIQAITPYADVLGFTGEGTFTGGTAEDRLKLLLETLEKITPVFDDITNEFKTVESEFAQVNPNRYPENFRNIPVRSYVQQGQDASKGVVTALTEFRPVIQELPNIAGGQKRMKYLILFQNDNEKRPTGGFLTAYSIIFVEDGKVTPEKSDDIYELDQKYTKKPPIPEVLGQYLTTEKKWNLRDMNTSPDFKVSMDQFLEGYKTIKSEPQDIDGIISVNTHVLTELVRVLGPIDVPGYGTFTAENDKRCDCPQIIYVLSEIITKPTPFLRPDRKGIIGPLMRAILTKAYTAPKQQWPQLFTAGLKSLETRDTQLYFFDEKAQAAAEAINAAGLMKPVENQDFLAIIDANLGGNKSDLFTNYEVVQTVSAPENGELTRTVEVTYRNSRKADNCNLEAGQLCLNATLNDWHRLYLPKGAELVDAQGFITKPKQYDENGFTVIDGFFKLEPNSQAKVKITYTVPYADGETYRLSMWKQGGVDPIKMIMDVNGGQEEITMDKDMVYEAKF